MIKTFFQTLMRAHANAVERNALARLSDHELRDIGLTRDQARDDNLGPIWDAPQAWKAPKARATTARLPRVASIY